MTKRGVLFVLSAVLFAFATACGGEQDGEDYLEEYEDSCYQYAPSECCEVIEFCGTDTPRQIVEACEANECDADFFNITACCAFEKDPFLCGQSVWDRCLYGY